MKVKAAEYIADRLWEFGIRDVFTVTGGGAMYLNDALGHHKKLRSTYHHHEQAAAMAAEAYARLDNRPAVVCVTSGPGAVNALTGVLCAWTDSIPMVVLSGQMRYGTTVRSSGLKLRTMGVQEYDIVLSAKPMTKYAVMVEDPEDICYHLERALYLAVHGRPGPVWIDLPLDIQGAMIDPELQRVYDPGEDIQEVPAVFDRETGEKILLAIKKSRRPVLFAGNGIRLSGKKDTFDDLIQLLGLPVVTGMSTVDMLETDHPLYVGRSGSTGDRAGNFALQNSDLLLSLGSRQSLMQTGFQYNAWARAAYTILNDIDGEELKKPNLHVDLPLVGDVGQLMEVLLRLLEEKGYSKEKPFYRTKACQSVGGGRKTDWLAQCRLWKKAYPVAGPEHYEPVEEGRTNIYAFYNELTRLLDPSNPLVISVGTARVAGSQTAYIKRGQRVLTNPNTASMGYGLPAAIGAARAVEGPVVCVDGEGSFQMNIQELQTIVQNRLPVKIFVINNEGYHSIRQTQKNFFGEALVGVGEESGDLSFPDLEKLAYAYDFPYYSIRESWRLKEELQKLLAKEGAMICQVYVSKKQNTMPKTASRRLEDGRMVSAPLEDMFPFLDRKEFLDNMYIEPIEE